MILPFCPKCGTRMDEKGACPACNTTGEKHDLYRKAFRAKRTVYLVQPRG